MSETLRRTAAQEQRVLLARDYDTPMALEMSGPWH